MKLGHTEIFVRDVEAARRFYEEVLGFEVTTVQGGRFVWLNAGGPEVLLRPGTPPAPADEYARAPTGLVLYTDDFPGTLAALVERGLVVRGTDPADGCAQFTDPDGNWFQLVDPEGH